MSPIRKRWNRIATASVNDLARVQVNRADPPGIEVHGAAEIEIPHPIAAPGGSSADDDVIAARIVFRLGVQDIDSAIAHRD
jgi:hypothetical protein